MILIAKNADFSENAIEKINIQKDLSEFSKSVLKKMTKYNETSTQAFAFDAFQQSLKDKGLWDKINNIYIPALAKDLSECFCDIIGDLNYDVSNIPSELFELSSLGGIKQKNSGSSGIETSIMPKLNTALPSFNNISAVYYMMDDANKAYDEGYYLRMKRLLSFKNQLNYFCVEAGGSGKLFPTTMVTVSGSYPTVSGSSIYAELPKKGFFGFTRNESYSYDTEFFVDGERYEIGERLNGTDTNITNLQLFAEKYKDEQSAAEQKNSKAPSIGLFVFMKSAITTEEMRMLEIEVNYLMDSLLVE